MVWVLAARAVGLGRGVLVEIGSTEALPRSRAAGFERQQAAAVRVSDEWGGGEAVAEVLDVSRPCGGAWHLRRPRVSYR